MKTATRRLIAKWVFALLFTAVVCSIAWLSAGCAGPVTPDRVASRTIAFDGGEQNAGVLKAWPGGALLTDNKKAEYDALVALYGRGIEGHQLVPPVELGRGLTALRGRDEGFPLHERVWVIDGQALTYFLLFKEWQRTGLKPL